MNSVRTTVTESGDTSTPYGWDWSATTHEGREGIVDDLAEALGTAFVVPGGGLQGWSESLQCFDPLGFEVGRVYWGGGREDVHVLSTSAEAHSAREAVRGIGEARTARVDTRVDTLVPFDVLADRCWEAVRNYGVRLTRMESWDGKTGESLGRTAYLGAPSSAVRVRIYEKHLESPGQYEPGTNRVEVQLRPASRVKRRVSEWSPGQTFCASRTTTAIAATLGNDVTERGSLHVKRGTPTLEQTLEAMGHQYGKATARWLELSGGDVGTVLDYLMDPDGGPEPLRALRVNK